VDVRGGYVPFPTAIRKRLHFPVHSVRHNLVSHKEFAKVSVSDQDSAEIATQLRKRPRWYARATPFRNAKCGNMKLFLFEATRRTLSGLAMKCCQLDDMANFVSCFRHRCLTPEYYDRLGGNGPSEVTPSPHDLTSPLQTISTSSQGVGVTQPSPLLGSAPSSGGRPLSSSVSPIAR
jgi:hypothetical protein